MKRVLALVCLGLLVAGGVLASPWTGMQKLMTKGFSANMVMDEVEKDGGKLVLHSESQVIMLKHRMRVDMDLSKMETGKKKDKEGMPPGLSKMWMLTDMDRKVMDTVYPDSKMYMESDLSKPNKMNKAPRQDWFRNPDMTLEDVGAETVDGHPCRKVKATWKSQEGDEAEEHAAYMWLAKDLEEFPVKIQPIDEKSDNISTLTYKDVKIGHVDEKSLEVPAGFKKGGFMDLMKASIKGPRPHPSGD
ncbi:MAG TPA: DUF4412 domain-containing protein [Candidatus Saccharimonadales bacterium]|nr:DUF4412 domain-containing protein [Candidatus Saccharimonadales bacterium]